MSVPPAPCRPTGLGVLAVHPEHPTRTDDARRRFGTDRIAIARPETGSPPGRPAQPKTKTPNPMLLQGVFDTVMRHTCA